MLKMFERKQETLMPELAGKLYLETNPTDRRRAEAWLKTRIAAAKKLHKDEMTSEVVLVTPALAELVLAECNTGNRKISPSHVAKVVSIIKAGRWLLTSQGVSISREGRLNDGQHKLSAVVQSGCPILIRFTFGECPDAFQVLDTGMGRCGKDTLHILGYKAASNLSATARLVHIVTSTTPLAKHFTPPDQIRAIVESNPGLVDAINPGFRVRGATGCSVTVAAAAIYLIKSRSKAPERFDTFIDRLADGDGLRIGDPIKTLREGMTRHQLSGELRAGGAQNVFVCAAIINAWNLWIAGRQARAHGRLLWGVDQPFPQPE